MQSSAYRSSDFRPVSFLGNLVWLVFGGIISAVGYWLSGLALCLTIVGIPFGIQAFKLGTAMLAPFGREVHAVPEADNPIRIIFNLLWLVLFGWEIAISHLVWAIVLCVTVVGIPFGMQHLKMIPLALFPFGRSFER